MEFKHMQNANTYLGASSNKGKFLSSVSEGNSDELTTVVIRPGRSCHSDSFLEENLQKCFTCSCGSCWISAIHKLVL